MPVGDCPMVFPTIMEMLIKQDGNLQKRHYAQTMLHFSNILSWLIDHVFLLIMSMFFGKYCIFCILKITIRCCIFLHIMTVLIVHGKICLQFTCIFCIFAVPYTWKTRDGRKMHQTFWSFRSFRTE